MAALGNGDPGNAFIVDGPGSSSYAPRTKHYSSGLSIPQVVGGRWKDWALLAVLAALIAVVHSVPGRQQYLTEAGWAEVKYPFQPNTVPSWTLGILAVVVPLSVIVLTGRALGLTFHEQHGACLGLLTAVVATTLVTEIVKLTVGRPRPSFFYRCFPSGQANFTTSDNNLITPICRATNQRDVTDGYKSFPSGHTSISTAGLFFLTLFLLHQSRSRHARQGSAMPLAEVCIALVPTVLAVWVGCTRISDYAHNYTDVCAGGFLGGLIAYSFFSLHVQTLPPDRADVAASALAQDIALVDLEDGRSPPLSRV